MLVIPILLAVLLAILLAVIAWFRFIKGLWLPALVGFSKLPQYEKSTYYTENGKYRRATGDEPIAWYMGHPAFQGKTHLVFSAEDRFLAMYCRQSFRQFCVSMGRAKVVDGNVKALNYLLTQLENEVSKILTCIYSQEEIAADPWKAKVVGVLYKGEPDKPLAIIAPGGGFAACMSDSEGYPYAMQLHEAGYSVFVLTYRVGAQLGVKGQEEQGKEATTDLVRTVTFFRDRGGEYGVTLDRYAIFGSSAGGLMATAFAFSNYPHNCHEYGLPRPAAIFPIYGLHWDVNVTVQDKGLAVFSIVGKNDQYGFGQVESKLAALRETLGEENVDVTIYDDLAHGCCIGTGTVAEGWMDRAIAFWKAHEK